VKNWNSKADYVREVLYGRAPPARSPHPMQNPNLYCPDLGDMPWHDPAQFEWVPRIEAAYPVIRQEYLAARQAAHGMQEYREPTGIYDGYRLLHDRGDWNVFYFYFEGRKFDQNCALCPETARLLDSIPRLAGLGCYSVLGGGSHIAAHCAPFNLTLRCHLGLEHLEHGRIRVGAETRSWEAGKCLILDDSFEHEVWVEGQRDRAILMFDFYHPGLSDQEVSQLRELWSSGPARRILQPWYDLVGTGDGPRPGG